MKHFNLPALCAFLIGMGSHSANAALITHYTFEGNGNDSVGSRNLIVTNGSYSSNTPGGTGQSLAFNGTTTRAVYDVVGSDSLVGTYTVMAYVNYNAASSEPSVNSRSFFGTRGSGDASFDAKLVDGNRIHGDIGNGTTWLSTVADGSFNYSLNTWYNIAYSVTTTGYTVYVNGNQVGSGNFSGTPLLFDATHDIAVGNAGVSRAEFMSGFIDDVRIYNTALTQSEIRANLVPEPASFALVALGMTGFLRRRR